MAKHRCLRPLLRSAMVATCATAFALFNANELKAQTCWTDLGVYDPIWPHRGQVIGNTYYISSEAELGAFAVMIENGYSFAGEIVVLTADLDMSAYEWWPAGAGNIYHGIQAFDGTFDGQGHTIHGIRTKYLNGYITHINLGLFAWLNNATVSNVNLTGCDIGQEYLLGDSRFVGGIAGEAYESTIENVVVSGSVGQSASDVGGIAGRTLDVTIRNCTVYGSVGRSGDNMVALGGIVGYTSFDTMIVNCHNRSDLSGNAINTGGIAGTADYYSRQGTIEILNCSNTGMITVEQWNGNTAPTGGIVGFACLCNIRNCWNAGDVIGLSNRGYAKIGGLLGQSDGCVLRNCYNSGIINNDHSNGSAVSGEWVGEVLDYPVIMAYNCFLKLGGPYVGAGHIGQHPEYVNYRFGLPIPNDPEGSEIYTIMPWDEWDTSSPVGGFLSELNNYASGSSDYEPWTMQDSWARGAKGYPSFGPLQATTGTCTYWTDDDVRDQSWPAGCYDSNTSTYSIYTPAQLGQFAWMVSCGWLGFGGATVRVENDLDMSAHLWMPAGSAFYPYIGAAHYKTLFEFAGTFDGGNRTISGIRSNGSTPQPSSWIEDFGIIARLHDAGTIRNVRLAACDIHVSAINLGGIVGTVWSSRVENCAVSGIIDNTYSLGGGSGAGGIAGVVVAGSVRNCMVNADIYNQEYAGGITAHLTSGGIIDQCAVAGYLSGYWNGPGTGSIGGIAGMMDIGGIFNCDNAATLNAQNANGGSVGGIAGCSASSSIVANCRNSGSLVGIGNSSTSTIIGGIIGYCDDSVVYNCMSIAEFDTVLHYHFDHGGLFGIVNASGYSTVNGPNYWLADYDSSGLYPSFAYGTYNGSGITYDYFDTTGWLAGGGDLLSALNSAASDANSQVLFYETLLPWTLDGSPDGYPVLDGLTLPPGGDETWVHIDAIQVSSLSGVTLAWDYQPVQSRLGTSSFSYTIETSTDLASWQALVTPPVLSRVGNTERAIVPTNGDRMFFRVKAVK